MTEHVALPPFSAWSGPRQPRLLIVGEAWGQHEHELRKPFVGESGKELFQMLGEAMPGVAPELHAEIVSQFRYGLAWTRLREKWLEAAGVALTNTFNLRPLANKIEYLCCKKTELPPGYTYPAIEKALYLREEYLPELDRLDWEISEAKPNLVLACGAKASWALLRDPSIGKIRGAVAKATLGETGVKVLPTYHPAGILRNWAWRPIAVADLMKAGLEMGFREFRRPSRQIIYSPTLAEAQEWASQTLAGGKAAYPLLSCDTETAAGQVTMISFARRPDECLVIPFVDNTKPGWSYWESAGEELGAWDVVGSLLESDIPKLWQNGLYDLQYLLPLGFRVSCNEDTMLLHHSFLPEMQKGLGFLGSIYTSEASWKLMRGRKADTEKRDE